MFNNLFSRNPFSNKDRMRMKNASPLPLPQKIVYIDA